MIHAFHFQPDYAWNQLPLVPGLRLRRMAHRKPTLRQSPITNPRLHRPGSIAIRSLPYLRKPMIFPFSIFHFPSSSVQRSMLDVGRSMFVFSNIMSGVLAYTLGLEAGGFTSAISGADQKLGGFLGKAATATGVTALVGGAIAGMKKLFDLVSGVGAAFATGAHFQQLSKRTGETVQNLFLLEKGFKAAGLPADNLGHVLFMLQKAMGGVNEMGESTSEIFDQLGLNLDTLKNTSAPQQLQAILGKLSGLNRESAAFAASKIYRSRIRCGRHPPTRPLLPAIHRRPPWQHRRRAPDGTHPPLPSRKSNSPSAKLKGQGPTTSSPASPKASRPAVQSVLDALNQIDLSEHRPTPPAMVLGAFAEAFKERHPHRPHRHSASPPGSNVARRSGPGHLRETRQSA
jgi:hypothetical protein